VGEGELRGCLSHDGRGTAVEEGGDVVRGFDVRWEAVESLILVVRRRKEKERRAVCD
jgi:hypothetical protein